MDNEGNIAFGMVRKVFHIVSSTLLSRHKFVSTKSPSALMTNEEFIQFFFRYLKKSINDEYRSRVKSTGPHIAHIHHKILNFGDDQIEVSIDDTQSIPPLYCRKFGIECVASILIYMGIDEINYHIDFGFDLYRIGVGGKVLEFWTQCEDPDMLEWFLDNNVYTGTDRGTLCDDMIAFNVQAGRGENVMRLLRWKHDNLGLGHDNTPLMRL